MCKSICEAIIAVIIIIFSLWQTAYSNWIIIILAIILLIHSFTCKKCFGSHMAHMPEKASKKR